MSRLDWLNKQIAPKKRHSDAVPPQAKLEQIARTHCHGMRWIISTVNCYDLQYETAIITTGGTEPIERYANTHDARIGHEKWVERAGWVSDGTTVAEFLNKFGDELQWVDPDTAYDGFEREVLDVQHGKVEESPRSPIITKIRAIILEE